MEKVDCKINFNKHFYNARETVFGNIGIEIYENITVRKLILHVRGLAHCDWKSGKNRVVGEESLIFSNINLVPNRKVLQKGNHQYDFNFTLPQTLPPSAKRTIENTSFEIKYDAIVFFIRSLNFDLKFKKEFKVLSGFNLNLHPEFKYPMSLENDDLFALVSQRGYAAGDEIFINVQLKKFSENKPQEIVFALHRDVSYDFPRGCGSLSRSATEKIFENFTNIPPGQRDATILFKIPEEVGPPSTHDRAFKIVNIKYTLSVLKPKGLFQFDSPLKFSIIIGKYPVQPVDVP